MSINRLLNTTADLYRTGVTRGASGGVVRSMTVQTTGFPCRISSSSPAERMTGDERFAEATGVIYVASTEDVQRGDEVRKGSDIYGVLGVRDPSKVNHHREIIVKREERADKG